ncbi:MAG: hypothetical protein N2Z72_06325 [Bacteroidales bacterium]|nr:hypothetical protein [Bacteroidales bacterium]
MLKKTWFLWLLAILIGLGIMFFQRLTGPTYPLSLKLSIEGQRLKIKFPRSWTSGQNAKISISSKKLSGQFFIFYRRYKSHDVWQRDTFSYQNGQYVYNLPTLPPAGKMMYSVVYSDGFTEKQLHPEPVILRYKGYVPTWILILHVLMMILSVFYGIRAGLEALIIRKHLVSLSAFATLFLFVGGLILGPVVQYYAFGAFWTGWPFGHDLTDNKTALSLLVWLFALWRLRKHPNNWKVVLIASLVQVAMYFIPHSLLGSELDFVKENI